MIEIRIILQKIFIKGAKRGVLLRLAFIFLFFLLYWNISDGNGHLFADMDIFLMNFVAILRNVKITGIILFLTYLGNWQFIISMGLVIVFLLIYLKKTRVALFLAVSSIAGESAITFLKMFLHRTRPDLQYSMIIRDGFSFPSGHAVISVVFYGFIAYILCKIFQKNWQKILICFMSAILIVLIGFTRVYLGVHWPSDVFGGWLVGLFVLSLSIIFSASEKK